MLKKINGDDSMIDLILIQEQYSILERFCQLLDPVCGPFQPLDLKRTARCVCVCVCVCVCLCLSPELIPYYVLYNFVKNNCLMLMTFSLSVRTIKDPYFRANSGLNGSQSRDFSTCHSF